MSTFNQMIKDALAVRKPLAIGKIGWTEQLQLTRRLVDPDSVWWDRSLAVNSGFYPLGRVMCERWAQTYTEALGALDGAVQWQWHGEDKPVLDLYAPQAIREQDVHDLMPTDATSWIYALGGKDVLMVHPMAHTIYAQAPKFSQVWPGAQIGKVSVVETPYPPALGRAPKYVTWFDALDALKARIAEQKFDIAFLGCGSYGLPLAKFIKETHGAPAIHLGGKAQLLFGIRGKRWDKFPIAWREANRYDSTPAWTRPLPIDRPFGAHLMDYGCYW